MKKSVIKDAMRTALDKLPTHPERNGCYIHFSFIIQDGSIICFGVNNRHTIVKVNWGYHRRHKGEGAGFRPKGHSEINAYKKAVRMTKFDARKPFEIINIRLNNAGELRISKPCECCYELLKCFGCRKFWYSTTVEGFLAV